MAPVLGSGLWPAWITRVASLFDFDWLMKNPVPE
jgi:hypothetical protein